MPNHDDSQDDGPSLLAGIARGDRACFATLFDRYAAPAFGLAFKVCNNQALAEDVVQEAFLSIWKRAGQFDPQRGSASSYLFSAVHNKAVDAVRHEESMRRRTVDLLDNEVAAAVPDVVEAAWLSVRRAEVHAALGRISALQREALVLAYFEGLTYEEVALKLGVPLGTAKTRLRDGLLKLRSQLTDLRADLA